MGKHFSIRALKTIIKANLAQDGLRGQIGHPEFHFDDNTFKESYAYIESQQQIIKNVLVDTSGKIPAWEAFGRFTHTVQDFYAHSNYILLWAGTYQQGELPAPNLVDSANQDITQHPDLRSGNIYLWDWLAFVPGLNGLARIILPPDSHTHMNLDSPSQGELFPYALEAAVKRTKNEFEWITKALDSSAIKIFLDQ